MINIPAIYLLDSSSIAWRLGVTNSGQRQQTETPNPSTQPLNSILLADITLASTYWSVGVSTGGDLQSTETGSTTGQTQIVVQSPDGNYWAIKLNQGQFQTLKTCVNDWQIGLQYNPQWNNVNWSQPGGIGTVILPGPANGPFLNYPVPGQVFCELSGLWTCFCGHWFDAAMVLRDFDCATGDPVALVCCPICSAVQYTLPDFIKTLDSDPQFGVPQVII